MNTHAKKRLNNIVIFTILFCLLFVGGWVWKRELDAREADAYRVPPSCLPQSVREVKVELDAAANAESGEEKSPPVHLVRTDTVEADLPEAAANLRASWEIESPKLGEADALFAQRIIADLCSLPTAQRIESPDLAALGLANPRAKVTFLIYGPGGREKLEWRFQFGSLLPDRRIAVQMLREKERDLTYSIPDKFFQLLTVPAERFRNRRVLKMPLDRIDAVTMAAAGKERFTAERAGADWRLLVDGKETGASADAIVRFVNRLATLRALDIVEAEVSGDECAKRASAFELRFEGIDRSRETVRFSRLVDAGGDGRLRILACGNGRRALFGVHRDLWKYLDVEATSFRTR